MFAPSITRARWQQRETMATLQCQTIVACLLLTFTSAIRMPNCRPDGTFEINDNINTTDVICDEISINDVIVWSMTSSSGDNVLFGNCSAYTACTIPSERYVSLFRTIESMNSTLRLRDLGTSVEGGAKFTCYSQSDPTNTASCKLDKVHPAEVESCTVQAKNDSFTAELRCDVTRVMSSIGRYQCAWYRGTTETSQDELLDTTTFNPAPHSDPDLFQGSCSLTSKLVPNKGSYFYRAIIYPGAVESLTEPLVLEEPTEPEMHCSPDFWSDSSTTLTCSCSTDFAGYPPGKLQYVRGGKVGVIHEGNYGDLTLDLPPINVSRDDLDTDRAFFSCRVQWVGNSPRDTHTVIAAEEDSPNLALILGLTFGLLGGLLVLCLIIIIICCCCFKVPGKKTWDDRQADSRENSYFRDDALQRHYQYTRNLPGRGLPS